MGPLAEGFADVPVLKMGATGRVIVLDAITVELGGETYVIIKGSILSVLSCWFVC